MEVFKTGKSWAAAMVKDLLESEGISAHVRETFAYYHPAWYIVYIEDPAQDAAARRIVTAFEARGDAPENPWKWRCPNCGEDVEAQFTACWNCQTPNPSSRLP